MSLQPNDDNLSETRPETSRALGQVRGLARILDEAITIPGTSIRIGLDPILGLIPGGGDIAGGVLTGGLVLLAARAGAPGSVLTRMVINLAIDAAVGNVPLLGDVFDVAWRANTKNAELFEKWLETPRTTQRASRGVVALLLLLIALLVIGAVAVGIMLMRAVAGLIT
jgi:hypothetical protein